MTRRGFLFTPLLAPAQSTPRKPTLRLLWTTSGIPEAFARQAIVFDRAYTCCPSLTDAIWSLEHGRFPHARSASAPSLWDHFDRAYDEDATFTILTAHSADGLDSPAESSIRVPFALQINGSFPPSVTRAPLSHAHVFDMLLTRRFDPPADPIYVEGSLGTRNEWRALIRGFDKLIWNLRDEVIAFYNLATDPTEQHDLQDERDHRTNRDSMIALSRQWMERLQDGIDPQGFRTRRPQ